MKRCHWTTLFFSAPVAFRRSPLEAYPWTSGNRTTTGSLSASPRTTPYQLSRGGTWATISSRTSNWSYVEWPRWRRHQLTAHNGNLPRQRQWHIYKFQASKDLHFPRPGVSLTYLLLQSLANPNILPPKQQPTTMLELAVELGNSLSPATPRRKSNGTPEGDAVPPLMTAVLHRQKINVQLLLEARTDPWRTTLIVSLCDHPWYWFGFLSRHESINAVQIAFVQGPEDTMADLLPNIASIQQSVGETQHPNYDDTAMTDHAKILLGNLVQKYYSSRLHITRRCNTTHRWRHVLEGLYLPVRIREELRRPGGLAHPGTLLDQLD